jgi:hypothetical protein
MQEEQKGKNKKIPDLSKYSTDYFYLNYMSTTKKSNPKKTI